MVSVVQLVSTWLREHVRTKMAGQFNSKGGVLTFISSKLYLCPKGPGSSTSLLNAVIRHLWTETSLKQTVPFIFCIVFILSNKLPERKASFSSSVQMISLFSVEFSFFRQSYFMLMKRNYCCECWRNENRFWRDLSSVAQIICFFYYKS